MGLLLHVFRVDALQLAVDPLLALLVCLAGGMLKGCGGGGRGGGRVLYLVLLRHEVLVPLCQLIDYLLLLLQLVGHVHAGHGAHERAVGLRPALPLLQLQQVDAVAVQLGSHGLEFGVHRDGPVVTVEGVGVVVDEPSFVREFAVVVGHDLAQLVEGASAFAQRAAVVAQYGGELPHPLVLGGDVGLGLAADALVHLAQVVVLLGALSEAVAGRHGGHDGSCQQPEGVAG